MTPARITGALLAVVGLVLSISPTLVYDPGPAADLFATIERRIPWGGLLGVGLLLMARTRLQPYAVTAAAFVLWVTLGLLVARGLGLALDGSHPRQWMWVGVELMVVVGAAVFLQRQGGIDVGLGGEG